jgi:CheY-like chemotaxis protein
MMVILLAVVIGCWASVVGEPDAVNHTEPPHSQGGRHTRPDRGHLPGSNAGAPLPHGRRQVTDAWQQQDIQLCFLWRLRLNVGRRLSAAALRESNLMSTTIEIRRRVLFIDDDPAFLEMIARVLHELSQGAWEILVADNVSKALDIMQERPVHLAVLDIQMPVLDGTQFLRLLSRRHPQLIKAVLTGFASDSARAESLSQGADLFLEKPRSRTEQESLYAALNELLKTRSEDGFQGLLRRVGLVDVIQLECLSGRSCVLTIQAPRRHGEIFIRDGNLIHAACGELTGQKALNRLLRLQRGEFRLVAYVDPPEQSLHSSWESLLMEAAQVRDEMSQSGESDTLMLQASDVLPRQTEP